MAKFISLTEICGNGGTRPVLINVAHIQYVYLGSRGKDVRVGLSSKSFFVKESFAEIMALVVDETEPCQPVVLSASDCGMKALGTVVIHKNSGSVLELTK